MLDMVWIDTLFHSSAIDTNLTGNNFSSYMELQFMCNGIFLFCVACFFGYAFGDLPWGFEYLTSDWFWMFRYLNLNEEDIAKELYMGYGVGLGPLLVILPIWFFWAL